MPKQKPPKLIHLAANKHSIKNASGTVLNGKKYFYEVSQDTLIREDMLKHRKKFREWAKFVEFVNSLP